MTSEFTIAFVEFFCYDVQTSWGSEIVVKGVWATEEYHMDFSEYV